MSQQWQDFVDNFDDDMPSSVRGRKHHDAITTMGNTVLTMRVELEQLKSSSTRADALVDTFNQRLQRVEQTLHTGTNNLSTRVALLENRDQSFKEELDDDRQALQDLKDLSKFLKNFPFGLKGLFLSVVIAIILVAMVTDAGVRNYVYKRAETQIMESK